MIIGYGIDVIEPPRIEKVLSRFNERFLNRIYTPNEIAYCSGKNGKLMIQRYASFWAVKEATMKALGTGYKNGVRYRDIEVCHEDSGKPRIELYGKSKEIADLIGADNIAVSISDVANIAVASVIFEKL